MEGWDGSEDGKPSDLTTRRWRNFGLSGAKWIWGGEAVAVRHDGRANPNQLLMTEENAPLIEGLRDTLFAAHQERFGQTDDLFVGLQITHSGRWARPNEKTKAEPRTIQRNPPLDRRLSITDDSTIFSDDELKRLVDDFVVAGVAAAKAGFSFVDVKHCHGYLGHEILAGVDRPGPYGGSLENRVRFLREIVEGIRSEAPDLAIGTRLSLFDFVPYGPGPDGVGRPEPDADPRLSIWMRRNRIGLGSGRDVGIVNHAAGNGDPHDLHLGGRPVCQSTHSTSGDVSAERRLPTTRGSNGGCGPTNRGDG